MHNIWYRPNFPFCRRVRSQLHHQTDGVRFDQGGICVYALIHITNVIVLPSRRRGLSGNYSVLPVPSFSALDPDTLCLSVLIGFLPRPSRPFLQWTFYRLTNFYHRSTSLYCLTQLYDPQLVKYHTLLVKRLATFFDPHCIGNISPRGHSLF